MSATTKTVFPRRLAADFAALALIPTMQKYETNPSRRVNQKKIHQLRIPRAKPIRAIDPHSNENAAGSAQPHATIERVPGVYLSYPFCAQKCTYCNFASGVFPRDVEARYRDALLAEIRGYPWPWRPETVYLGGGTPSSLLIEALRLLLDAIPGKPWTEATIEAAPGLLSAETARGWVECGINRVSMGVQSFVDLELRRTGRRHTAEIVAREVALLREAGIANLNIDLIAGLSGQTESSWNESLDWIERLAPPHVSIYMLEVDEESRLGKEMLIGGVRYGAGDTPSDDQTAAFYQTALERLARIGIERYEISNFARPGWESRHNLKYWKLEPYAGFGADAHSFDGCSRRQNPEDLAQYLAPDFPALEPEPAGEDERFFVGLRLMEGVRPTPGEWLRYQHEIHRFVEAGLLETDGRTLRLTPRGVLFSNEVFQEFVTK
jgi:oxygen-independent coproporphyrinogen-3 oxidase